MALCIRVLSFILLGLALGAAQIAAIAQDGPKPVVPKSTSGDLLDRAHVLRKPRIPSEALSSGIFGTVAVRVKVAPDGDILSARAISGPPQLRPAAVEAAKAWEFRSSNDLENSDGFLIFRFDFGEAFGTIVGQQDGDRAADKDEPVAATQARVEPPAERVEPVGDDVIVPIVPAKTLPASPKKDTPRRAEPAKEPLNDAALSTKATRKVAPKYPSTAANAGIEGVVTVEVLVDEKGKVTQARALSGPAALRDAAVTAARQWTFAPARIQDQPAKTVGTISFNFKRN